MTATEPRGVDTTHTAFILVLQYCVQTHRNKVPNVLGLFEQSAALILLEVLSDLLTIQVGKRMRPSTLLSWHITGHISSY